MGFAAGSVTFRRFMVLGKSPDMVDEKLLEKLSSHVLEGEGGSEEIEYGWCGGRHVLDGQFSFERNVFAECLFFAIRIDTNRVPSEIKRAYQLMEEDAAAAENPSGFVSKQQKRLIKDSVQRKLDEDRRSGKFRRSKLVPILWDLASGVLYTPASQSVEEKLVELFERTFKLELSPQSAGAAALRFLENAGKRRDYEDLRATRFVHGPGGESHWPEYPWSAKGPEPKDFLGNELLLWLWHEVDAGDGTVKTDAGEVAVVFDRLLDLDCAYGQGGRDLLRGSGPTQMPEAHDAIKGGKVPRRAGLMLECAGSQFTGTFSAESFTFSSFQFPEVEEAENERVLFEERIGMLRDLCKAWDGIYTAFLKARTGSKWEGQTGTIRKWIQSSAKAMTAV